MEKKLKNEIFDCRLIIFVVASSLFLFVYFHDMLNGSIDEEWDRILVDKQVKLLLQVLEAISLMDKRCCISSVINPKERDYIEK